jgi:uncharacterized membrane protein YecN with MAPEG domain
MLNKLKLILPMFLATFIIIGIFTFVYFNPMQMQLPKEIILSMAILLPTLTLIVGVFRVAMIRAQDVNIQNPLNEQPTDKLILAKQYLSNTLEQFVIAFVVYYIVVSSIPPFNNYVVILLGLVFFIGRVFYFFGYKKPFLKGFGFSLTFFSTLFGFLVVLLFYGAYFYYILTAANN